MNSFFQKISISFILILSLSFSFSQSNNPDNHYHTEGIGAGILTTGNTGTGSNINVVYHRCNWAANPDDATKTLTGSVTTYFKTTAANVSSISFDFNNSSFNNAALNVLYHGTICSTIFPNTGNVDVLNIILPTTINIVVASSICFSLKTFGRATCINWNA